MADKVKEKTKKSNLDGMSLQDARLALQKYILDMRSGLESDTSKVKKLKKYIARMLTKENNN